MIYAIESGMVLLALALAFAFPNLGSGWMSAAERAFGRLAARPRLSVAVVGIAALAVRAALLPILPIPEPACHDEFSYLLAADTFAHGRLTNPTHPLWIHFETFHELWHPTYASMFPPAQGLVLAFGQVVLGHPFWGVWLSTGAMCAALCWMLQGWVPPKWALLGGMLAVMRLATFSYWANTYWGGAVAATGGALLYGALPRVKHSLRVTDGLLLGLGVGILANSRPYEGLMFSLPVAAALLYWMMGKDRPPLRVCLRRVALPTSLLLGVFAVLTCYYFWRVTGSPWRMPNEVYHHAAMVTPYFFGQTPNPVPNYHHAVLRNYYLSFELNYLVQSRSLIGVLRLEATKIAQMWDFFVGPVFTLPFLMSLAIVPYGLTWGKVNPQTRFLLIVAALGLVTCGVEVYSSPHYAAPGTCILYALLIRAMQSVRAWTWHGKPVGLAVARAVPVICLAMLAVCAAALPRVLSSQACPLPYVCGGDQALNRASVLHRFEQEPGRHLVIVRYSPEHSTHSEWVYNRADIDGSKVVWAHDMGPDGNRELITYFHDRKVWLVEPDRDPPVISPYTQ